MIWLKRIAGACGLLLLALAALYAYATTLPETHSARVEVFVAAPPAQVRARVTDWQHAASWKPDVQRVEALPPVNGRSRYRECTWECIDIEVEHAGEAYLGHIVDNPDFGGTWTWTFEPEGAGTRVTLIEDGIVHSPVFRLFMRHVFGTDANIRATSEALAASW